MRNVSRRMAIGVNAECFCEVLVYDRSLRIYRAFFHIACFMIVV